MLKIDQVCLAKKLNSTFEIFKFEKWPHPVRVKTKMEFHVSLGFHGKGYYEMKAISQQGIIRHPSDFL